MTWVVAILALSLVVFALVEIKDGSCCCGEQCFGGCRPTIPSALVADLGTGWAFTEGCTSANFASQCLAWVENTIWALEIQGDNCQTTGFCYLALQKSDTISCFPSVSRFPAISVSVIAGNVGDIGSICGSAGSYTPPLNVWTLIVDVSDQCFNAGAAERLVYLAQDCGDGWPKTFTFDKYLGCRAGGDPSCQLVSWPTTITVDLP